MLKLYEWKALKRRILPKNNFTFSFDLMIFVKTRIIFFFFLNEKGYILISVFNSNSRLLYIIHKHSYTNVLHSKHIFSNIIIKKHIKKSHKELRSIGVWWLCAPVFLSVFLFFVHGSFCKEMQRILIAVSVFYVHLKPTRYHKLFLQKC